jgi:hypothetical protein
MSSENPENFDQGFSTLQFIEDYSRGRQITYYRFLSYTPDMYLTV